MSKVRCFLLVPTKTSRYSLRRYSSSECPGPYRYHDAQSAPIAETADVGSYYCTNPPERPGDSDPRWPTKCAHCDYRFAQEDNWQVFGSALYKRADNSEVMTLRDAPAGAMWDADWWPSNNPDGKSPCLKLPDGYDWMIDDQANNCACLTRRNNPDPAHRCWTRSGTMPDLTANPSILSPGYHGWLRNGYLESC